MIIDSHVHLDNYYYNQRIPLEKRLFNLKKIMKTNNISKSIIIADIDGGENGPSMQELVKLLKNEKNILLVGTIKITKHNQKDLNELRDLLVKKRIIGIKLYPGYENFYPFENLKF